MLAAGMRKRPKRRLLIWFHCNSSTEGVVLAINGTTRFCFDKVMDYACGIQDCEAARMSGKARTETAELPRVFVPAATGQCHS